MTRGAHAAPAVALLALALAVTPAPAAKPKPTTGPFLFAGVPWLLPADSVAARLRALGYQETPNARTASRLEFTGRLFERFATMAAQLDDQGRLLRWEIRLLAGGKKDDYVAQRQVYDQVVAEMEAKYGRRSRLRENYRFPYERGDDREVQGLRDGLVDISSEWSIKSGDRLVVRLDHEVAVAMSYESPQWSLTELERRKHKAKDF